MFVLRTGLQGNGKTLNTIKEVDQLAANQERTVYYHNIRGFNPNADILQAIWVEFDDPLKWFELPQNAIIVIDEAQTFFRVRKSGAEVPDYASALETMRHRGHELHCITQNPSLIDLHFRKLCNSHIHYVRGHKGKIIKRWSFEMVNLEVERKQSFEMGEQTRFYLDKDYFSVYESVADGSEHHFKFNPPKALWVLIIAIIVIIFLSYKVYNSRLKEANALTSEQQQKEATKNQQKEEKEKPNKAEEGGLLDNLKSLNPMPKISGNIQGAAPNHKAENKPLTKEEYLAREKPRLEEVPYSAPIYDQIRTVKSYPILNCMSTQDYELIKVKSSSWNVASRNGKIYACACFSQFGYYLDVSFKTCMDVMELKRGFDWAKEFKTNDKKEQIKILGTNNNQPQIKKTKLN